MPTSSLSPSAGFSLSTEDVPDLVERLLRLQQSNAEVRASRDGLLATVEHLENRLATQTRHAQQLAAQLATAEQRERGRISQLLHDHLQPLLHGAKMWAETLQVEGDKAPPESLDRIVALIGDALDSTRSLAVELSSPILETEGLAAALRWLAEHVDATHGLAVTLDVDTVFDVSPDDSTEIALQQLLFEGTRELLFNVVKHAGVDRATVRARQTPEESYIEVVDAGIGGASPASNNKGGLGLRRLRERLALIGGTLTIASRSPVGTCARICIPKAVATAA